MVQSKGTSQGAFFDTKDMRPLIDNEAFRKALKFLKESGKYGPPDELNPHAKSPALSLDPRKPAATGRTRGKPNRCASSP